MDKPDISPRKWLRNPKTSPSNTILALAGCWLVVYWTWQGFNKLINEFGVHKPGISVVEPAKTEKVGEK